MAGLPLQDPDSSYELYYKLLDKLKREHIPSGEVGQPVRDEINRFVKEGKEKGRDVRQARTSMFREAINEITTWVQESGGNDVMSLFNRFRDLNREVEAAQIA